MNNNYVVHPSSFILHPSSFILHPSSFILFFGVCMPTYEGSLTTPTGRFAIVAAKFNHEIVERLVAGAKDALHRQGIAEDAIDLAWVPGAFELPLVAQKLAGSKKYAAVICLGAVIRGDTDITITYAAPPPTASCKRALQPASPSSSAS
jgi:6,7-dimethyl-8-ribityllumazine synthase